ncbi:MAG: hypothetical protein EAZ70_10820 [Runella slithyformis]|nr:MAG: hypothetical protein EAY79_08800 [Runella slithyformis]TAF25027.1 MAG: hypothetical protein EAZ70_10820 [Runella slithyformis]TAF79125.1 MAG: hypothetical protein EAZ50_12210 [Runella slithyformis]
MKKHFILLFIWFSVLGNAFGQIPGMGGRPGPIPTGGGGGRGGRAQIDDTTKQIYGPKTTRFFLEEDVFNNQKTLYTIDTSTYAFHQYNYVQRAQYQLVDLGNIGTATRPVFFKPVAQIGAQFGYNAYTPYAYALNEVKFYDTKSPYTNMYLVLGGVGQNMVRFDHNQNINPRLNIGFNAQRFTTNKQFGTSGPSDPQNNLAANWAFVWHANYRTKDDKYTLLAQFNYLNHFVFEQGGIVGDSTFFKTDRTVSYFEDANRPSLLRTAYSWERRSHWHVYQQYVKAEGFQLYHVFDFRTDKNYFYHPDLSEARKYNFYQDYFYNPNQTDQAVRFNLVENKFGAKGRYKKFDYRLHYRNRIVSMTGVYNVFRSVNGQLKNREFKIPPRIENFAGLWVSYFLKDSTQRLTAETEISAGSGLKIKADLVSKFFSVGYSSVLSPPTLLQQRYESNHLRWNNATFGFTNSNNVYGVLHLATKNARFEPSLDYHLLTNYIYFDSLARPAQFNGAFSVLRLGALAEWKPGRWQFLTQFHYSAVSNDKVLRIPPIFVNFRTTFDFIYAKVLFIQLGIDLHYKSAYFADAYMPLTQQFYLQNRLQTEGYLLGEAFANFRINRVRLFVKLAHATNAIWKPGYFQTPFYPVVGRSANLFGANIPSLLSFGVNWPLFD